MLCLNDTACDDWSGGTFVCGGAIPNTGTGGGGGSARVGAITGGAGGTGGYDGPVVARTGSGFLTAGSAFV